MRRETIKTFLDLAKATQDAPTTDELLTRYSTALDNDLVKIARELREAQAWRQKTLTEIPLVAGVAESLRAAA